MIFNYFDCLWRTLTINRHRQFWLLLVLIFLTSFAEIISIGMVLPFLSVLTSPDTIFNFSLIQPLIRWFHFTQSSELILPLTIVFAIAALISGAMRALLIWASAKFTFAVGNDLSTNIFRRTLHQPYEVHDNF